MPAYDVLFVKKPTVKALESGAEEEIISGPHTVLGKDSHAAAVAATMVAAMKLKDIPNSQVEVLVRTFQK